MIDAVFQWQDEHVRFSRLLSLLENEASRFHEGDEPDYVLMRDIVCYLREIGDRVHHPREDAAFERLATHDPALRLPVNRLRQEHCAIATAGEELLRRLDEIEAGAMVERRHLEEAAANYLVCYRHHLATEERDILPRAEQLLTHYDWRAVAAAVPPGPDPLFGNEFESQFPALHRRLAAGTPPGRGRTA